MKPKIVSIVTILWLGGLAAHLAGALAAEPPPKTDSAVAKQAAAAPAAEEFKPPPGFLKKKRGKFILYCKRDTPLGSRIRTETCYDENQMRNYMLALQETKGDVDKIRNVCSNPCACGMPEAC
jgi:hypothetical protein